MKKRERLERLPRGPKQYETATDKLKRIKSKKKKKSVDAADVKFPTSSCGNLIGVTSSHLTPASSSIWGVGSSGYIYYEPFADVDPRQELNYLQEKFDKWAEENNKEELFFTDYVVGFRAWTINPETYELCSITFTREKWVVGENTARCAGPMADSKYYKKNPVHKAPYNDCQCGLYATFNLENIRLWAPYDIYQHLIVGAVAMWGDLEVHEDGMRAEKACVLALAKPAPEMIQKSPFSITEPAPNSYYQSVADKYEVPLVNVSQLPAVCATNGEFLPSDAIPQFETKDRDEWIRLRQLTWRFSNPFRLYP